MVTLNQVEVPFYRGMDRKRKWGFRALVQVNGRTVIPFLLKYIVLAAKRLGADFLDFAAQEIAEGIGGTYSLKTAAKSVGRQTLGKQLGGGGRKGSASRVIPTKSAKQTSRSQRHAFRNISQKSCPASLGTNLLWQFREILKGKSQ